jgi:hypothetical protein
MLRSIKELYGKKLAALDGELGHVKDFYFDDQNWAVRYVVADSGAWLPGRQILISPHAFGKLDLAGKLLTTHLTRKQIEESPSIELHKPVSRQYEQAYYQYYGWPYYWNGGGLWGMSGFPILAPQPRPISSETATFIGPPGNGPDAHLRSTRSVSGYQIQASDGTPGHVCDFMMDERSWAIGQLVVKTGHRFSGKETLLATSEVDRISYEKSTVFVKLTRNAIKQGPERDLTPATAVV